MQFSQKEIFKIEKKSCVRYLHLGGAAYRKLRIQGQYIYQVRNFRGDFPQVSPDISKTCPRIQELETSRKKKITSSISSFLGCTLLFLRLGRLRATWGENSKSK